jgi:hypothetical protein
MSEVLIPATRAIKLVKYHTVKWYDRRRAGEIKTTPNGSAEAGVVERLLDEQQADLERAQCDLEQRRTELAALVAAASNKDSLK